MTVAATPRLPKNRLPAPRAASASAVAATLKASGIATLPATRTLELLGPDSKATVATLTYHLTPPPFATLQILNLEVSEPHRRQGHATRLYDLAVADARKLLGATKLRRVFTCVPHKSHLNYRALLSRLGLHHTSTTPGLLKDEDLLFYIKSYT